MNPAAGRSNAEILPSDSACQLADAQAEIVTLRARVRALQSERVRLERAARERVARIAETTNGWFWETDADLRFTYMSPSVERITGLEPEWHYGRTRAELGAPDSLTETQWRAHLERLARREPFRDFLYLRKGPDGLRWLRTSGDPVFDDDGVFVGYCGSGFDATREVAARKSSERLVCAVENLNEIFVLWGPDDRLILCNARFRELNARTPEAVRPGTPFEEQIRRGLAAGLFPDALGREEEWMAERIAFHRDPGPGLVVLREGRRLMMREYKLTDGCTVTLGVDITQRLLDLETLAEQNRLLETALATIPDGVHVLDADLKLVAWNDRLWEVMDLDGDAILAAEDPGKAFRYALAGRGEYGPGNIDDVVARREAIARTPVPVHYERQLVTGKWIECRGTPIPGGGYVAVYRDISMRLEQERLERLAREDDLTGLANRRSLLNTLRREFERAARSGEVFAVLVIDIDNFKPVNDNHGHRAGDRVLQAVSHALSQNVRAMDTVARYGGDEFAVVLPGVDGSGARPLAERLRAAVESLAVHHGDSVLRVTVSMGLAGLAVGDNCESIIARADAALYTAKREGRNRVVVATP